MNFTVMPVCLVKLSAVSFWMSSICGLPTIRTLMRAAACCAATTAPARTGTSGGDQERGRNSCDEAASAPPAVSGQDSS